MRIIKQFAKKITLSLLLSIFLFFNFFSVGFFRPIQVKAIPVEVLESAPQKTRDVWDQVQQALLSSALGSLVNAASYFTRKIAYDMAKGLADAAVGKKPAIFQQSPGDYLKDVALDTAASAIADFGSGALGINFCTPPDLNFQLSLQVGLSNIYSNEIGGGKEGPQPSCSWSKMQESWGDVKNKYSSTEIFNANLDVTQGGLGTTLVAKSNIDKLNAKSTASADAERAEGDGFKAIKDTISGKVKTPAQTVKSESEAVGAKQQGQMSASQIAGIYAVDAWQIIPTALSTFANTFISTLANNILKDGLFPTDKDSGKESVTNPYASVLNYNRKAAESVYSYLTTDIPVMNLSAYDYVTNFSVCPDNPAIDNCVFDENWQNILNRAKTGEPLTIKQAVEQGLLNENLIFYSEYSEQNGNKECFRSGLCYSNLQKMRKARIIPLGFEIVASLSQPANPITLKRALAEYYLNGSKLYGLINPNWILKAPEARIKLQAYTENIVEGTNTRNKEVIDYDSCVEKDSNGKCIEYGYCLQEKNTWSFYGDSCDKEFNTCKTFKNNSTGEINSYLSRTLEYGDCNLDSVGCSAYSIDKILFETDANYFITDSWNSSYGINNDQKINENPRNNTIFLTSKQEQNTCPAEADGCSAFEWEKIEYNYDLVTLETTTNTFRESVSLKKAPDYLYCYDANPKSTKINWPQTNSDLIYLENRPAECENYAQVCLPDEVGCSNYVSVNSGETIGGKVELENWCPNECVGYETFRQNASAFEEAVFPLYFIPSRATTCSAGFAGCDEFTRLSQAGGGSESLVYFYDTKKCELPDGENAGVFYSWEGSADSGFVLRKHDLKKISSEDKDFIDDLILSDAVKDNFLINSPAYENDSSFSLSENYNSCNQEKYNRDLNGEFVQNFDKSNCTALYDDEGNIFYRNLNKTVTVSSDCQLYRKTNSDLYKDTDISDREMCLSKGGKWQGSDCLRCYDNGFYVAEGEASENKGSCQYQTILNEASICPASANGCRLYIGNNGNNLYEVFKQDFEPTGTDAAALTELKTNWCQDYPACNQNNIDIKPESTYVGGNSLRAVNTDILYHFDSNILFELDSQEKWFTLTFWAKGDNLNLEVYFDINDDLTYFTKDIVTDASNPVILNNEWREYKLGPILLSGAKNYPVNLHFDVNKNGTYFIDNVKLEKVGDSDMDRVAVIKNSWKTNLGYDVPEVCDNSPLDPYPGRYLGCKSYSVNNANNTESIINLTGFAKLCRENAIGCAKLQDTYNREDEYKDDYYAVYNFFLDEVHFNMPSYTNGFFVPASESGDYVGPTNSLQFGFLKGPIYFKKDFFLNEAPVIFYRSVVSSTYVIPPVSDPVYMTLRQDYLCDEDYIGCTKMAKETQIKPDKTLYNSYDFSEVFLINKPNVIKDNFCTDDLVGCGSYSSNNLITYFKDPVLAGNTFCEYKTGIIDASGNSIDGWYQVGVGACETDGISCLSDSDCEGTGNFCANIGNISCVDLPSNASENYAGKVGLCDSKDDGCTKFIDHADVTIEGYFIGGFLTLKSIPKEYYRIYNEKLTSQTASCEGKVSQEQGCILLDREEYPNKLYNSITTYDASRTAKYNLVPPKSDGSNDSNLLLKVKLDRECDQWLSCKTKTIETDSNGNKVEICVNYGLNKEPADDGQILDKDKYLKRIQKAGIPSWYDSDYTGYALFNKRNIDGYKIIYIANTAYLVYQSNSGSGSCTETKNIEGQSTIVAKDDFTPCQDNKGLCWNGNCILPIDDQISFNGITTNQKLTSVLSGNDINKESLYRETCKTFPEASSPFDIRKIANVSDYKSCFETPSVFPILGDGVKCGKTIYNFSGFSRTEYTNLKSKYSNAYYCQGGAEVGDCSCQYKKVEYKDGTVDFLFVDTSKIAPGVCSGLGDDAGRPCQNDAECGVGGICNKQSQVGEYRGLTGLCMEYDKSKGELLGDKIYYPCLTWYYSDRSVSQLDLFNFYKEAGYNPGGEPSDNFDSYFGELYCIASTEEGKNPDFGENISTAILDENYNLAFNKEDTFEYGCNFVGVCDTGALLSYNYFNKFKIEEGIKLEVSSKYREIITSNNIFSQYVMLNEWAKNIDNYQDNRQPDFKNIRILRFDAHHAGKDDTYAGDRIKDDKYDVIKSFAPAIGPDSGEYGDVGTLIHPDRFNDNGSEKDIYTSYKTGDKFTTYGFYHNEDDSGDFQNSREFKIYTSFLSPNFVSYNNSNSNNSFIYVSPLEKTIKEDEIARIHVVPLYYLRGAEGYTLSLLDGETFTIDFNLLRDSESKIFYKQADSFFYTEDDDLPPIILNPDRDEELYYYPMATGENNSDVNFVSYLLKEDDSNISIPTYGMSFNGKNKINSRYVGYFFTNQIFEENKGNHPLKSICGTDLSCANITLANAIDKSMDPFYFGRENTHSLNEKDGATLLAIGLDFNEDGDFLGYISRFIDAHDNSEGENFGMRMAVIVELNSKCEHYAVTYDKNNLLDNIIKPRTDLLWSGKKGIKEGLTKTFGPLKNIDPTKFDDTVINNMANYIEIIKKYSNHPFGSLNVKSEFLSNSTTDPKISTTTLSFKYHYFESFDKTGNNPEIETSGFPTIIEGTFKALDLGSFDPVPPYKRTSGDYGFITSYFPGANFIDVFFPAYYYVNTFGSIEIDRLGALGISTELKNTAYSISAPKVFGVRLDNKNKTVLGKEDTISINKISNSAIIVPGPLTIVDNSPYNANINFYAYADDDQMPIKQVKVDFGEGKDILNAGTKGLYQNHKPYCGDEPGSVGRCLGTQITCDIKNSTQKGNPECIEAMGSGSICVGNDIENFFGDSNRACTDIPFDFSHKYVCGDKYDVSSANKKNLIVLDNANCFDGGETLAYCQALKENIQGKTSSDYFCYYQPRVQITDNWGYCNNGYYGEDDANCHKDNISSWTKFKGYLIVLPEN